MFRIQPGVHEDQEVQRTFENAKFAMNSALLVERWDLPVDSAIALLEFAAVVRTPFFMSPTTMETTRRWSRGHLHVEWSAVAQNQTFIGHVMGAVIGSAPVDLVNLTCACAAGAKVYRSFTTNIAIADLRPYDGIVIAPEVAVAPAAADRYVITTQLTFRPFAPFATP